LLFFLPEGVDKGRVSFLDEVIDDDFRFAFLDCGGVGEIFPRLGVLQAAKEHLGLPELLQQRFVRKVLDVLGKVVPGIGCGISARTKKMEKGERGEGRGVRGY
jgi:hypothetical protein